jgi:hypothetical protein
MSPWKADIERYPVDAGEAFVQLKKETGVFYAISRACTERAQCVAGGFQWIRADVKELGKAKHTIVSSRDISMCLPRG